MKRRYWIAILCAVLALVLTVAATSADTGDVYGRMTDAADLHDGDRIILVSDDGSNYQAMATDFSGMQVTLTDNTITEQNGMLALTLTETDGGWLLASNDGYLAVTGGALTIVSDSADAAVWTISIASDGTATVSCTGGAIVFAEQDGAYRFFCGEGGNEIAIYNASLETEQHPFGGGLWWSFADGKLTIGGSGAMPDFSSNSQPWNQLLSNITEVEIQNGVTRIGNESFSHCNGFSEITIPDSVTSIGYRAFQDCRGLIEIKIPDCVTSVGGNAFSGTGWWNSQSNGIVYLDYILLGVKGTCGQIARIKEGTRLIAPQAFLDQSQVSKVTIPDSATSIGSWAFSGCTRLQSVTIGNGVTSIESYAFYNCTALTSITMPCSASIGYNAFVYCTGITSVHLTKGTGTMVEYSSDYTNTPWYRSRENAITITLDDGIQNIGNYAFGNCTGLSEFTIPDSVTSISYAAFYGCTGLSEITIPDSVTSIGNMAFYNCTGLTSVTIGNDVTSIGIQAFSGCTAMTDVYYLGTESERIRNLYISIGNDYLLNATWHYLTVPFEGTIEWNPEDVKYKGTTAYVIANGSAQTPRFTVKNSADGSVVDPANYDYEYRENTDAGTGYVIVTFKGDYEGTCRGFFKIYLPPTATTTVENVSNGIKLTWSPVEGAAGYVIYRRAWSSTTDGWTTFERWNNTTGTTYIDGADDSHKVYAGTRYQYGVKAYFARRVDPVTGATIGGNVGDNFNLGEVGPLKTTVRITTRVLNSVTAGSRQMTVKWTPSKNFTGYQIKYATDANFTKNVNAIKITNWSTAEKIITGLTRGTTYYVTIRSYHEFNGMTYFGEWSNVKSCRVR